MPIDGTNFYTSTSVPYVDWTSFVIDADYNTWIQVNGISNACEMNRAYLSSIFGLSEGEGIEWFYARRGYGENAIGVKDGKIVAYAELYRSPYVPEVRSDLPFEFLNVVPYYAQSPKGYWSLPWLVWKCNNAYFSAQTSTGLEWYNSIYDIKFRMMVLTKDTSLFSIPDCEMYTYTR